MSDNPTAQLQPEIYKTKIVLDDSTRYDLMIYEVEILLQKILTSQASRSQRFAQNKYASKSMSKPREETR